MSTLVLLPLGDIKILFGALCISLNVQLTLSWSITGINSYGICWLKRDLAIHKKACNSESEILHVWERESSKNLKSGVLVPFDMFEVSSSILH